MKKTILTLVLISTILVSCSRSFTPHQAANRGGLKCGKHTLR
jgi:hypothetical protein